MKNRYALPLSIMLLGLTLFLVACGPTVNQPKAQQTVSVNKSFQAQSPVPTIPAYRCGAWASNNAPNALDTILIYAKITKNVEGVAGATARATVHFRANDVTLDQQPTSDNGGFVNFSLPLMGRQPKQIPATVDVSFTIGGTTIPCSEAFFTPT